MSLICLCVTNVEKQEEQMHYQNRLIEIAKYHERGIKFAVNWSEPVLENIKGNKMIVNLLDDMACDNCEMLLLPDGWFFASKTNKLSFKQRMEFLHDIAAILLADNHSVEFYIGLSGTNPDDFLEINVKQAGFIDALTLLIGEQGVEGGSDCHITVTT